MQQWRWQCYIQIVYALFKFFQLEVRITKFEYTATLEPSKLYRTLSFYLRGYGMQQNLKLQFDTTTQQYIHSSPFFLDPLGVRAQIIRCGEDHCNERLAKVKFTLVFLLSCYMRWRYQYTNVPREVTTFLLCPKSKFKLKEKKRHLLLVRAHHSGIKPKNS